MEESASSFYLESSCTPPVLISAGKIENPTGTQGSMYRIDHTCPVGAEIDGCLGSGRLLIHFSFQDCS